MSRGRGRRPAAAPIVLVVAVVLAGCGRGSGGRGALRPTLGPTTTFDVTRVPANVDIAYVQTVMDALDHGLGEALRLVARDRAPSPAFLAQVRALYAGSFYDREVRDLQRLVANQAGNIRPDPRDPRTQVERLIGASHDCLFFTATRDLGPVFVRPPALPAPYFVELLLKRPGDDPGNRNPTTWAIAADGANPKAGIPANPCR